MNLLLELQLFFAEVKEKWLEKEDAKELSMGLV